MATEDQIPIDFDIDISVWLFGRPAGLLPAKLTKPAAAFFIFITVPAHLCSAYFFQDMWADILKAVAYAMLIPSLVLLFMALQQDLAKMLLKITYTWSFVYWLNYPPTLL